MNTNPTNPTNPYNNKINLTKNKLLTEMCLKQRKKADKKYFLELNDLVRLLKNIDNSIFNKTECVLWKGYLTKCNNNKSSYVNFYLKKRKLALHRILYINFIDDLDLKYYLKYTCDNPGKCCNINHIIKVYNDNNLQDQNQEQNQELLVQEQNQEVLVQDQNQEIKNEIYTRERVDISLNLDTNIKITKINNNSNIGKILIIFDD